jgi:hypothetical protein
MPITTIRYSLFEYDANHVVLNHTRQFLIETRFPIPSRDILVWAFRTGVIDLNQHIPFNKARMEDWKYQIKIDENTVIDIFTPEGVNTVERLLNSDATEISLDVGLPTCDHAVFDAVRSGSGSNSRRRHRTDDDEEELQQRPSRRRRTDEEQQRPSRRIQLRAPTVNQFDASLDDNHIYQNNIQFNHCLSNRARDRNLYPMDYEFICLDLFPEEWRRNYFAACIAIFYAELVEGTSASLAKWRSPWLGSIKLNILKLWNIVRGNVQSGKTAATAVLMFFSIFRDMTPVCFVRNKGGDQHMKRIKVEWLSLLQGFASYLQHGVDARFLVDGAVNVLEVPMALDKSNFVFIKGSNMKAEWSPTQDQIPIYLERANKDQIDHAKGFLSVMRFFTLNFKYSLLFDEDDEGIVSIDGVKGAAQHASFVDQLDDIDWTNNVNFRSLRNLASMICSVTATITNLLLVGIPKDENNNDEDADVAGWRRRTIQLSVNPLLYKGYAHDLFTVVPTHEIDPRIKRAESYADSDCYALQREPGIRTALNLANRRFRAGTHNTSLYICCPSTYRNRDRIDLADTLPLLTEQGSVSFIISENLRGFEEFKDKLSFYVHPRLLATVTPESILANWDRVQLLRPREERITFSHRDITVSRGMVQIVVKPSQRDIAVCYKFAEELSKLVTGLPHSFVACVTGSSYGSRCHTFKNYDHQNPITDSYTGWQKISLRINDRTVQTVNWVNIIQSMRMFSCDNLNDLQRNIVMPQSCVSDYHDAFQGDQVLATAALRIEGTLEDILAQLPTTGRFTEMLKGDAALHLTKNNLMTACKDRVNDGAQLAHGAPVEDDWVNDEVVILNQGGAVTGGNQHSVPDAWYRTAFELDLSNAYNDTLAFDTLDDKIQHYKTMELEVERRGLANGRLLRATGSSTRKYWVGICLMLIGPNGVNHHCTANHLAQVQRFLVAHAELSGLQMSHYTNFNNAGNNKSWRYYSNGRHLRSEGSNYVLAWH